MSLDAALQWEKSRVISVTEFVEALQNWQGITQVAALKQLHDLVIFGLSLHAVVLYPATKLPHEQALQTIYGAVLGKSLDAVESELDLTPSPEMQSLIDKLKDLPIDMGILRAKPRLANLIVDRLQTFHMFKAMGVEEPYPWTYPSEWLNETTDLAPEESGSIVECDSEALSRMGRDNARTGHAYRRHFYNTAKEEAKRRWSAGEMLNHANMAKSLLEKTPESISPDRLRKELCDLLREMERPDLIKGDHKKRS